MTVGDLATSLDLEDKTCLKAGRAVKWKESMACGRCHANRGLSPVRLLYSRQKDFLIQPLLLGVPVSHQLS